MKRILFFLFALFAAHGSSALAPIPELTSPVIDTSGTLSTEQIRGLAEQSMGLQREKGSQLQILLVPSTQPEDIAQYAQRVFDQWKLGREKADDGVLLIVAKEDRRVRIHVGYGLESDIPDIKASQIINENIIPYFKKGDYAWGVIEGTWALKKIIEESKTSLSEFSEEMSPNTNLSPHDAVNILLISLSFLLISVIGIVSAVVVTKRKYAGIDKKILISQFVKIIFKFAALVIVFGVVIGLLIGLFIGFFFFISTEIGRLLFLFALFLMFNLITKGGTSSSSSSTGCSIPGISWDSRSSSFSSSSSSSDNSSWSGGGGSSGGGGASESW
jgi:uncharacterized protein